MMDMKGFLTGKVAAVLLSAALLLPSATMSARGIDPVADSLANEAIKAYLDSVRVTRGRPAVALVLSGGGAKGAAHIGIVRRLEELDIPVDIVIGTSMGGLFGGLMAMGYNSYEMEDIVTSLDWEYILSDKLPRKYMSLAEMKYKSRHQISLPFYYQKRTFIQMKEDAYSESEHKYKPLSFDADKGDALKLLKDNLWESLPSGFVYGQNVTNLISSLTAGYQEEMNFLDLPIPFVCVATDLVSFKGKYWTDGNLPTALRSTMSIPGLFAPVKTDGMVLVDGGMRDNYPTSYARSLGADIIIGMELSDANKIYQEVNNLGDVVSQVVDLLTADNYARNKDGADLKVKPDLHEFNMLSFSSENIDTIIERGYSAAIAADSVLMDIKSKLGADSLRFKAPHAADLRHGRYVFEEIVISGVNDKEAKALKKKIDLKPGTPVGANEIDDAITKIYSTQAFDYVTYKVYGDREPFVLDIQCRKGPVSKLGVGLRFDSEEILSLLLDVGIGSLKLKGPKMDLSLRVAANPSARVRMYYDSPYFPTVNLAGGSQYTRAFSRVVGPHVASESDRWSDGLVPEKEQMNFWYNDAEFYLSGIRWKMFDFKLGARMDHFKFTSPISGIPTFRGNYDQDQNNHIYFNGFFDAFAETFDKNYFPDRGFRMDAYYSMTFASARNDSFKPHHIVALDGKFVVPAPRIFAFIPSYCIRAVIGDNVPLAYSNIMGGNQPGRYAPQQVPFAGINYAAVTGPYLGIIRTDFRFNLCKNHYLTAIVNYAKDGDTFKGWFSWKDNPGFYGTALEYSYNTIVGPLSANVHYSNLTRSVGAYVSLGLEF